MSKLDVNLSVKRQGDSDEGKWGIESATNEPVRAEVESQHVLFQQHPTNLARLEERPELLMGTAAWS